MLPRVGVIYVLLLMWVTVCQILHFNRLATCACATKPLLTDLGVSESIDVLPTICRHAWLHAREFNNARLRLACRRRPPPPRTCIIIHNARADADPTPPRILHRAGIGGGVSHSTHRYRLRLRWNQPPETLRRGCLLCPSKNTDYLHLHGNRRPVALLGKV